MTNEEFYKISAKWRALDNIEQILEKEFFVKAVLPIEKYKFISIFEYKEISPEIKTKVQEILDKAQHDVILLLRQEHIRLANEFLEINVEIKPTPSDHE